MRLGRADRNSQTDGNEYGTADKTADTVVFSDKSQQNSYEKELYYSAREGRTGRVARHTAEYSQDEYGYAAGSDKAVSDKIYNEADTAYTDPASEAPDDVDEIADDAAEEDDAAENNSGSRRKSRRKSRKQEIADDKDLLKLKKKDLLEIMLRQGEEIDMLRAKVEELEAQIEEREIKIIKAGSIAEASLALTNIFEEADKAVQLYLETVRRRIDGK